MSCKLNSTFQHSGALNRLARTTAAYSEREGRMRGGGAATFRPGSHLFSKHHLYRRPACSRTPSRTSHFTSGGSLLACLDALAAEQSLEQHIFVIGATNNVDSVDSEIYSAGRLELHVPLAVPTGAQRLQMLRVMARHLPIHSQEIEDVHASNVESGPGRDAVLKRMARRAHGFVASDLKQVLSDALARSLSSAGQGTEIPLCVDESIIMNCMDGVRPAALRGRKGLGDVTKGWADLEGIDNVKAELQACVLDPLAAFSSDSATSGLHRLGLALPRGVLLYGPAGTGKTALALGLGRQAATLANFIHVQGTEVLSSTVGASEKAVSRLFRQARACSPCILFIDDVDALAPVRGNDSTSERTMDRLLSQILMELDGIKTDSERPVLLLAATSRPEAIDPALLRPGRLDHHILVPPPSADARAAVLRRLVLETLPCEQEVAALVERLALDRTKGYSMADLAAACRSAGMAALREGGLKTHVKVQARHLEHAFESITPSLTGVTILHPFNQQRH